MLLAKTNPQETLYEHTFQLLKRYQQLVDLYKDTIDNENVWKLLRLASVYHDAGKAYTYFQNRLKKSMGIKTENRSDLNHIPHNYLSPLFLPLNILKLDKHSRRILIQAIAYHHERDESIDPIQIKRAAEEDLINQFEKVQKEFRDLKIKTPEDGRFFNKILADMTKNRIKSTDNHYATYVLVKGLLHRLDHAASAHIDIELDGNFDLSKLTEEYLKKLTGKTKGHLRPLQQFALENQDKNLILTAQTGIGKTEAALLWAGKKKTFFTVPLRVSLNALYDRVSSDMNYPYCGLLHSSSAHHLDEKGIENWEVIYDQSKHFSNKIIFTTIDQILKFPFKFRGYEKYYATLAHSCVIIDEIQAYSPWIVAVIIKSLEMLHKIGGKFMVMTATLPKIYLDSLKEKGIIDDSCVIETFSDDTFLRHRFEVRHTSIFENTEQIISAGKSKKVLVIVNTVNQAIKLYEKISKELDNVYLFHSRFLQKDRQQLERKLKSFDKNRDLPGIWITTQIVEASIDIDFDELYTELAPLDSLFQRFGRCYRKRRLDSDCVNIFIFTEEVSGKDYIYDSEILNFSYIFLNGHINTVGFELYESQKMKMVENLYSKETLKDTKFYAEFKKALRELEYIEDYKITFKEAQRILRGDELVMVIPRKVYDDIIPLFERLETEEEQRKRIAIRREIERYTCSVSKGIYEPYLKPIDHFRKTGSGKYPLMSHLFILDRVYDFDTETLKGVGINC